MRYLKQNGYNVVSLDKFFRYWEKKDFPKKTIAITIDDGYKSTMKAFKILKEYRFPFTVFLYMEAINRYPDFLNKNQIELLKKSGLVSFENHSYSHSHFGRLKKGETIGKYKKRFEKDLLKAEKKFEKLLGYKPKFYAYPYGEYTKEVVPILKKHGYIAAFTQDPSPTSIYYTKYTLPRQALVGSWSNLKRFKKILQEKPLPVIKTFPDFGFLENNTLPKVEAILKTGSTFKNCGIYISELGWKKAKVEKNKIFLDKKLSLKRWKNRIGFLCYRNNVYSYFYSVFKREGR